MEEALPETTNLHNPICDACSVLTLDAILKSPSISLRDNHLGLGRDDANGLAENLGLLSSKPPITLKVAQIRENHSRCRVCHLIYQQLDTKLDPVEDRLEVYNCEDGEGTLQSLWLYFPGSRWHAVKITLFANEDSFASKYVLHRPISSLGSVKSIQIIKNWLSTCDENHPRILDVGDVGETIYLVIANDASASYIALSHCWGGISQIRTTSFTLESHKNGIPLANLSKTVQDADDETDWFLEAGRMASVYEWAYCVIAATGSTDGAGGCFRPRQPQDLVQVPCQPQRDVSRYMYFEVADENAVQNMFQGPLNARAWVLQEHIFARRTIHFAADQTYWECDKTFIGEDGRNARNHVDAVWLPTRSLLCCILGDFLGPNRMPHLVHDPPQELFTKGDYFSIWATIVQFYTRCNLTKPTDKLPAILSLSTELQKLTGDEYHEGHWLTTRFSSYSFASSLLWRAAKERSLKKPSLYRAPSWSWAALDGPVEFVDVVQGVTLALISHPEHTDLEVLKVQVYRPIGLPPGKALLLSATMVRTSIFVGPCVSRTKGPLKCDLCMEVGHRNVVNVSDEGGKLIEGYFACDLADNQPIHFWLLLLYVRWAAPGHPQMSAPIYYALLVSEVANQRKAGFVFRRVGVGHVEDARPMYGHSKQFLVLI